VVQKTWCKRRHPNKGRKWIARKYFQTFKGKQWAFAATVKDRTGTSKILTLVRLAEISIERHIKVKGMASPDDPSMTDYWSHRQTRSGKTYWDKASKYYQVAKNQNWRCPVCQESLFNGEELHTHHIVEIKHRGTHRVENLQHLHQACHHQVHNGKFSELQKA